MSHNWVPLSENDLEEMIKRRPDALGIPCRVVGQQVGLGDLRLDLLLMDLHDDLLVVECKLGTADLATLNQVLEYTAIVASWNSSHLEKVIERHFKESKATLDSANVGAAAALPNWSGNVSAVIVAADIETDAAAFATAVSHYTDSLKVRLYTVDPSSHELATSSVNDSLVKDRLVALSSYTRHPAASPKGPRELRSLEIALQAIGLAHSAGRQVVDRPSTPLYRYSKKSAKRYDDLHLRRFWLRLVDSFSGDVIPFRFAHLAYLAEHARDTSALGNTTQLGLLSFGSALRRVAAADGEWEYRRELEQADIALNKDYLMDVFPQWRDELPSKKSSGYVRSPL